MKIKAHYNGLIFCLFEGVISEYHRALDAKSQFDALAIAERLDPALCRLKVGKELFTHEGPIIVKALQDKGFDVFWI